MLGEKANVTRCWQWVTLGGPEAMGVTEICKFSVDLKFFKMKS